MLKLIRGKKLFDGRCLKLDNPEIVIEDNYIKEIREKGTLKVPENTEIINLDDQTIIPGLIDTHIHTLGSTTDPTFAQVDRGLNSQNEIFRVARITNELRDTLFAGFTTLCDAGSQIGSDLSKVVEQEIIQGPRIYSCGNCISPTCGTFDQLQWPLEALKENKIDIIADGVDECIAIVRRRIRNGARVIKIGTAASIPWDECGNHANGSHPLRQVLTFTLNEVKAIVETAHKLQIKVSCHAIGDESIRMAVEGGADFIVHGQGMSEETRKLVLRKKIIMVPTITCYYLTLKWGVRPGIGECFYNSCKSHLDFSVREYKKNLKEGIKIALGTDMQLPYWPLGENELGLELLVNKVGMTPEQAIIAGTINGAEAIGVDKYLGSIEPGKFADIISVAGDPLGDINKLRDVKFVMKNGKTYIQNGLWVQDLKRRKLLPDEIKG